MSLLSGILQSQAPAKQDATSTIQTLCLRLTSSTLVEDRRAAVMGLRSFARDYKEQVASNGLRGLITTLSNDKADEETVKFILETLLLLFDRKEGQQQESIDEDIALWLADEFTQKQGNIEILIELLRGYDFFVRLNCLKILQAILRYRPERTQDSFITTGGAIPALVEILDDKRDAIRNAAILLLIHVADGNTDIQKLICFEHAFSRVFGIIELEGGLVGGIIVEDCLELLSSLLAFNGTTQNDFRENGFMRSLANLLTLNNEEEVADYTYAQRNINIVRTLAVVRLFVLPGGSSTKENQKALFATGASEQVLNIAFSPKIELDVRAEALRACADLINGNEEQQRNFAGLQVPYLNPSEASSEQLNGEPPLVYVIEALLDLALLASSTEAFNARMGAVQCLESYFEGNGVIRTHFLKRAIEGHLNGEDETANILSTLIDFTPESRRDPYRIWFASVILLHLVYGMDEAKDELVALKWGDEEAGEEVVTAVQAISGNLIAALNNPESYDARIPVAYLMLLCSLFYEYNPAVDDFLSEGASLQSIVLSAIQQSADSNPLVQGLCALLLGIIYEFSSKDSPIPRKSVHSILGNRVGRDQYMLRLERLRRHPQVRDFEISPQWHAGKMGDPNVFFSHTFIDFMKDNFTRVLRAFDKDPGMETHRMTLNGMLEHGITMEKFESLQEQLAMKDADLTQVQNELLILQQKVAQHEQELSNSRQQSLTELQARDQQHQSDFAKIQADFKAALDQNQAESANIIATLEQEITRLQDEIESVRLAREHESQLIQARVKETIANIVAREEEKTVEAVNAANERFAIELTEEREKTQRQINGYLAQLDEVQRNFAALQKEYQDIQGRLQEAEGRAAKQLEELQNKHAELQEEYQITAENLRTVESRMADEGKSYHEQIDGLMEEVAHLEEAAARSQGAHKKELDALREELSKETDTLKEEAEKAKQEAETVKQQAEGLKQEAETSRQQAEQLKEESERLKEEAEKLRQEADKFKQEAENAKQEAERSKQEADKAKASLSVAEKSVKENSTKADELQTQLDDLLMVFADLEEKRAKDKARLKDLGQEVSDDEDDEDDEEEETATA
ncbi:hypothetical protein BJ508DRAFT_328631 [Ascobolus immersus RN42]|uniref:Vesicle tethering protein Uso1/P115-like head domain-containing protein n=1 Tax=Ascobolus immersus RN42 TaxID=1160509 RepID=A0A3N4HZF3_ASCIM|nr:hypothetical protein BJ508DRAFT_328631 [Ascobolus immersus RN42]